MKKGLFTILGCIVLVISLVLPIRTEARDTRETLSVGVPTNRCPIFYRDDDTGEIIGIGVDLMRAAADEAGYDVSFRFVKESTLKEALDNDEYDIILPFGSAVKSESGRQSIVSDNLFQTPFTVVTTGDYPVSDFNDITVGMLSSMGAGADTVKELYPGITIEFYDTMDQSISALRLGKVDALLHNSYVWSYVLQKPVYSTLKVQPQAVFSMDFRAGTLDTEIGRHLIERLNVGISGISDVKRQAITLDYTSRSLYKYDFFDYLYKYGLVISLIFLLLALLTALTLQKRKEYYRERDEKVRELMERDVLTGVYNLTGFRKRAKEILQEYPDSSYLLSYNNLKNFKFINDRLGWEAGDALLRFWVEKAMEKLSDDEVMGRVTADRFAILRRVRSDDEMQQIEKDVFGPVSNYFVDRGKEYIIQVRRGLYLITPDDYNRIDIDRMLDFARVAEKKVSNSLNGGYSFYNPEQWEKGKLSAEVCGHLQVALSSGEIEVWYQPQIDHKRGVIMGAEALCRWNHPVLGWISPGDFIPVLEEAGLIYDLDYHVWARVCSDLKRWNSMGIHRSVSVNLSRSDIRRDRDIPGVFTEFVRNYGISCDQLRIEITETAYAQEPDLVISTTVGLREAGFTVEMDDFGSGYSSLHMLKEVPVDRIKMDLHFLTMSGDIKKGRIIIDHIVQMVNDLDMQMIAEGVETEEQADFLREKGCNEMQGFYFFRPMPVNEFETLEYVSKSEEQSNDSELTS